MTKYIETQTRKVISSYGGVGSIIETPKGALIIEDFDKWKFFKKIINHELDIDNFKVEDNRLLIRLQHEKGFPNLKEFLRVPENFPNYKNITIPENPDKVISSKYFPEWFYCPHCEEFKSISDWWRNWELRLGNQNKEDFIPPKCYNCYLKAKEKKSRKLYYELEQVRFVMTAPNGNISDVYWDRWVNVNNVLTEAEISIYLNDNDSTDKKNILDFYKYCCNKQKLKYIKSKKFSDLAGIRIECSSCGKKNTLAGLFRFKLPLKNNPKILQKVVLRTSNSIYYPIIINSIYLPTEREIDPQDQNKIKKWQENGKDLNFIEEALIDDNGDKKYKNETIKKFINHEIKGEFEPEVEYRQKEYNFIIKNNNYNDEKGNLNFESKNIEKLNTLGISKLSSINRLKVTSVQTGYTRQEPLDSDSFLSGNDDTNIKVKAKYTSSCGKNTKYLPVVENFGEGIFISFSEDKLNNFTQNLNLKSRLKNLYDNCKKHEYLSVQKKFNSEEHLARFTFIHTFSHILIKELEFKCGYPSTSLNERLFINESNMQGLLIYTISGSEGSYGGLVSQTKSDKFLQILESAINRTTDCSSDPICYNSEDGQGIGGLNLAACYSCSLLPENACEELNSFLDRSLLIDKEFGFFKEILG